MTPRPLPDPVSSAPALIVFLAATVAAFFAAGYAIAAWLYERITKETP